MIAHNRRQWDAIDQFGLPTLREVLVADAALLLARMTPYQAVDPLTTASQYRRHFLQQYSAHPRMERESRYPHPYRWARVAAMRPVRLP